MTITVQNFKPADGSQIGPTQAIEFEVQGTPLRTYVTAKYSADDKETIWDGSKDAFTSKFAGSVRESISGGHRYKVRRKGGWTKSPTIVVDPAEQPGATEGGLHDQTHNPVGLWQLDGDLTDASPTGHDLEQGFGSTIWGVGVTPAHKAWFSREDEGLQSPSQNPAPAALRITGSMTVMVLVRLLDYTTLSSGLKRVINCNDGSNIQWDVTLTNQTSSYTGNPRFGWHNSGASFQSVATGGDPGASVLPGEWTHLALIRDTSGGAGATVGQIYINGTKVAEETALDPPGDFPNAWIRLGDGGGGGRATRGLTQSALVTPNALSAADVLAAAQKTLGPAHNP